MRLVVPSLVYKRSFIQAVKEYQAEKRTKSTMDIFLLDDIFLQKEFSSYIEKFVKDSQGINLPKGYVPHTTFWLVDKSEFIGRANIRHILNEQLFKEGGHIGYDIRPSKRNLGYGKKLLSLVLPKAKALGIRRVLITCDENNIPSKKIIEANGGVFENSIDLGEGKPRKLRYWINLA